MTLSVSDVSVNALLFVPQDADASSSSVSFASVAICTHGYTSHKGDLIAWADKLTGENIPTLLFDLPGHYLGSFNEVSSLASFFTVAPALFKQAFLQISNHIQLTSDVKIILGGHSLGALVSIIAGGDQSQWQSHHLLHICVGLGVSAGLSKHLFSAPLFAEIMQMREQFVSSCLQASSLLPELYKQKLALKPVQQKIILMVGEDDIISPPADVSRLKKQLEQYTDDVEMITQKHMPHNLPERAATTIRSVLKSRNYID